MGRINRSLVGPVSEISRPRYQGNHVPHCELFTFVLEANSVTGTVGLWHVLEDVSAAKSAIPWRANRSPRWFATATTVNAKVVAHFR